MDLKGDFQMLEFTVGKRKSDPSYARLVVKGKSNKHLEHILEQVYREGAQPVSVEEVRLEPAPKDMVMPDDFYSTTNNATQVFYGSQWIDVHNMMMDKCIVVDTQEKTAECKMLRDIAREDMIVVGEQGVKIIPQERPREGVDIFQFMSSSSSSERPTQHVARKVASDIYNTRKEGGKIVIVSGPVLVHSGAVEALASLIKMGYVDGLLAGNALAVHDVENALWHERYDGDDHEERRDRQHDFNQSGSNDVGNAAIESRKGANDHANDDIDRNRNESNRQ